MATGSGATATDHPGRVPSSCPPAAQGNTGRRCHLTPARDGGLPPHVVSEPGAEKAVWRLRRPRTSSPALEPHLSGPALAVRQIRQRLLDRLGCLVVALAVIADSERGICRVHRPGILPAHRARRPIGATVPHLVVAGPPASSRHAEERYARSSGSMVPGFSTPCLHRGRRSPTIPLPDAARTNLLGSEMRPMARPGMPVITGGLVRLVAARLALSRSGIAARLTSPAGVTHHLASRTGALHPRHPSGVPSLREWPIRATLPTIQGEPHG